MVSLVHIKSTSQHPFEYEFGFFHGTIIPILIAICSPRIILRFLIALVSLYCCMNLFDLFCFQSKVVVRVWYYRWILIANITILECSYRQSFGFAGSPSAIADHMERSKDAQPSINTEEDNIKSPRVEVEDELLADQIWATRKVNSIATIEALRFKLSSVSSM